jgi:hypothetical protein
LYLPGWQKQLRQIEAQLQLMESHRYRTTYVGSSRSVESSQLEGSICQECLRAQAEMRDAGATKCDNTHTQLVRQQQRLSLDRASHSLSQGQTFTSLELSRWDECQSVGSSQGENRPPTDYARHTSRSSRCSGPFPAGPQGRPESRSTSTTTAEVQVNLLTPSKGERAQQLGHQVNTLMQEV